MESESRVIPIPRKWGEKPYRSLNFHLKEQFGEKVQKLSLNGGMTCPNRDGTIGDHGCIFCSEGGSGDFAADAGLSITEQIESQKNTFKNKKSSNLYIAYFQAYTNTYAPVSYLEAIFNEAIRHPDIAALSIGTRPDCLPDEVLRLLDSLNQMKPVWIELGLQTIHPRTCKLIKRGYDLPCFETAVKNLRSLKIDVIVHTILGLPGEASEQVLQTIDYLNTQDIQGIKLQLLHILKNTELEHLYQTDGFSSMTLDEYIALVTSCLEHLSPEITIHRLTGDGPAPLLIAPLWSLNKRRVLNTLHQELKRRHTWQGSDYQKHP